MEKYSLYADYLTGKLLFNQPLPIYTALPMAQKITYQLYIYTFYWIMIVARLINVFLLPGLWALVTYVPLIGRIADVVFPRVILFNAGYFYRIHVFYGKVRFTAKLASTYLVCGTLTSPFDILVYCKAFGTRHVLLPECFLTADKQLQKGNFGRVYRTPVAFLRALFLEDLIFKPSTEQTRTLDIQYATKHPLLCFPEGTSTNGTGVLQSYLPEEFYRGRQIVAAACARPWRRIPRVHSRFGWGCIFDSLGAVYTKCTVKAVVLQSDERRTISSVTSAMAAVQGVQTCNYTIADKIRYGLNVDE